MANKKFKTATMLAATLALGAIALASCGGNENPAPTIDDSSDASTETTPSTGESTQTETGGTETEEKPTPDPVKKSVTFMIPNKDNMQELKKYDTKEVDSNGKLQMPEDPAIEGYTFRGWYLDKKCTEKFEITGYEFTKSLTLYGLFVEDTVKVHLIDGEGNDTVIDDSKLPNLAELEKTQREAAAAANLVFDGWYTNAACTTKYTPESEAIEIYGRYMAEVSFNNGYEVVETKLVKPGETVELPKAEDLATKYDYMSSEDMSFVDSEGNPYKPQNKVNVNTEIKVIWKTPFLSYELVDGTNDYVCKVDGSSLGDNRAKLEAFPVISIPSKVTINDEVVNVRSVYASQLTIAKSATKLIVNEGIEAFYSFSDGMGGCKLEEVVLPYSLRIIDTAFTGFKKLNKVELHEGLEIVYNSFWGNTQFGKPITEEAYPFITIPASVTNMVQVPNNLKLAEGSPFFYEDGNLYKNDEKLGKVLATASKASIKDNTLTVPEGVDAIQVGAFDGLAFKNLVLPESFRAVSYNNDIKDYNGLYISKRLTNLELVREGANPASDSRMDPSAYSVISNLSSIDYVIFNSYEYPAKMNGYAFNNRGTAYDKLEKTQLVFIKEMTEGEATISVNITAPTIPYEDKQSFKLAVNTVLTEAELLKRIGVTAENLGMKIRVVSVTQFGQKFDFSQAITRNTYLELEFESATAGFTYELDKKDKSKAYVTGFDEATAEALDNGGFAVNIPSVYEGKTIVGINDSAFEGNTSVVKINIASSVKSIGARAFYGASFLTEVNIKKGGLETIGAEAFKYVGCINTGSEAEPVWELNEAIAQPNTSKPGTLLPVETKITFPVSNLKVKTVKEGDVTKEIEAIGEEAFNSPAIRRFNDAEGEKVLKLHGNNYFGVAITDKDKYAFIQSTGGVSYGLVRIIKHEVNGVVDSQDPKPGLWSANLIASAAGAMIDRFALGQTIGMKAQIDVLQVTVKKGSVAIYEDSIKYITFGSVKTIEAGAFVYVNKAILQVTEKEAPTEEDPNNKILVSRCEYPIATPNNMFGVECPYFVTPEQIRTQDRSIFQEGWMLGVKEEEISQFLLGVVKGSSFIGS